MITLILNAAEGRVQFVLSQCQMQSEGQGEGNDGAPPRILCHYELDAPSRGTEILPPAIHAALKALQLTPADVNRIACVHGPGSFTGLRLVLSFAAAFRRVTGIPVGGINYLHALAASVPDLPGTLRLPAKRRVLTHARRNLVHRQDFLLTDTGPVPVSGPEMVSLDAVLSGMGCAGAVTGVPTLLIGSGYTRNAAILAERLRDSHFIPLSGIEQPTASALAELANDIEYGHNDLEPLYLRPCDAVDNLPHIAAKRGQSAEEALLRLELLLDRTPEPEA